MKSLLVFHPLVAPYRLDLFNKFSSDFDTTICLTESQWEGNMFEGLENQYAFKPKYLTGNLGLLRVGKAIQILKKIRPNVVIVSECGILSILITIYCKLFFRSCRVVELLDDSYDMISYDHHFSAKHKWSERLLLPMVDQIICVEPRVADCFKEKYGKGFFFPIIRDERLLRAQIPSFKNEASIYNETYGTKGNTVFLFVGRLVALKNVAKLIKAFLSANMDNALLVIVGDGEERDNLMKEAGGDARVVFTGRLEGESLYAWYDVADVFILPSYQESFGAVTNEALIMGCYCLVSNLAGSSCLIEKDVNGSTFDPYDTNALSDLLLQYNYKVERDTQGCKTCLMTRSFNEYYVDLVSSIGLGVNS